MLEFGSRVPEGWQPGDPVVILLHGRGSHGHDLLSLAPGLPAHRYLSGHRVDVASLEHSLEKLDWFFDDLADHVGGEPGPVVLGGFSQGATTSLAYARRAPDRLAGVLVFSGFMHERTPEGPGATPDPDRPESAALASIRTFPPVFWGHGTLDRAVPFEHGEHGRAELRKMGVELTAIDYPVGHWVAPAEVDDASEWLRSRFARTP